MSSQPCYIENPQSLVEKYEKDQSRYKLASSYFIMAAIACIFIFYASVTNSEMFGPGFNYALI